MSFLANSLTPAEIPEEMAWGVAAFLEAMGRTVPRNKYVESIIAEEQGRKLASLM